MAIETTRLVGKEDERLGEAEGWAAAGRQARRMAHEGGIIIAVDGQSGTGRSSAGQIVCDAMGSEEEGAEHEATAWHRVDGANLLDRPGGHHAEAIATQLEEEHLKEADDETREVLSATGRMRRVLDGEDRSGTMCAVLVDDLDEWKGEEVARLLRNLDRQRARNSAWVLVMNRERLRRAWADDGHRGTDTLVSFVDITVTTRGPTAKEREKLFMTEVVPTIMSKEDSGGLEDRWTDLVRQVVVPATRTIRDLARLGKEVELAVERDPGTSAGVTTCVVAARLFAPQVGEAMARFARDSNELDDIVRRTANAEMENETRRAMSNARAHLENRHAREAKQARG